MRAFSEHLGFPWEGVRGLVQTGAVACAGRAPVSTTRKPGGDYRCRFSHPPKIALIVSGRTKNRMKVL